MEVCTQHVMSQITAEHNLSPPEQTKYFYGNLYNMHKWLISLYNCFCHAIPSLLIFVCGGVVLISVCGFCCKDSSVQNQIVYCLLCFFMFFLCAEYCKF